VSKTKKKVLLFVAIYFVIFVALSLVPQFLHRQDFDRAFTAYLHNPSPATKQTLKQEQIKNRIIEFTNVVVGAAVILVVGVGFVYLVRVTARAAKPRVAQMDK